MLDFVWLWDSRTAWLQSGWKALGSVQSTAAARSPWLFLCCCIVCLKNTPLGTENNETLHAWSDLALVLLPLLSVPSTQPGFVFRFKLSQEFYGIWCAVKFFSLTALAYSCWPKLAGSIFVVWTLLITWEQEDFVQGKKFLACMLNIWPERSCKPVGNQALFQ